MAEEEFLYDIDDATMEWELDYGRTVIYLIPRKRGRGWAVVESVYDAGGERAIGFWEFKTKNEALGFIAGYYGIDTEPYIRRVPRRRKKSKGKKKRTRKKRRKRR